VLGGGADRGSIDVGTAERRGRCRVESAERKASADPRLRPGPREIPRTQALPLNRLKRKLFDLPAVARDDDIGCHYGRANLSSVVDHHDAESESHPAGR
jgi:hypothetical protein